MNTDQNRLTPEEWHETASLVGTEEADLPAGRHTFHRDILMTLIHESTSSTPPAPVRRRRFLRPLIVVPASIC